MPSSSHGSSKTIPHLPKKRKAKMRMMCFGNSLSDRGSLYNVVDIVSFGLYNPPEKLDNYAKVTNVVPLQANLQDY